MHPSHGTATSYDWIIHQLHCKYQTHRLIIIFDCTRSNGTPVDRQKMGTSRKFLEPKEPNEVQDPQSGMVK